MTGGQVCGTCKGTGRVYTARGIERCPELCGNYGADRERERAEALNQLAHALTSGKEFAIAQSMKRALACGHTVEGLAERLKVPRERLRRGAEGQGLLPL